MIAARTVNSLSRASMTRLIRCTSLTIKIRGDSAYPKRVRPRGPDSLDTLNDSGKKESSNISRFKNSVSTMYRLAIEATFRHA